MISLKKLGKVFREGPGGSPRDFETIRRSFQRKVFGLDQRSSAPFLSGDTFKFGCDIILEGFDVDVATALNLVVNQEVRIFAQGLPMSFAAEKVAQYCKDFGGLDKASLIIHNCDQIPTSSDMEMLSRNFKRVYSVNWLGDPEVISPLPIGLENRDKRRNGVPTDYGHAISRGLPSFESRDINFLVCFSLHTNRAEREVALEICKSLPGVHIVNEAITPKQYRELVLRSKFVVSPPGNGPDCHRTWEALYLGSTPIVKKESWPFNHLDIPVIILDEWDDINRIQLSEPVINSVDWQKMRHWLSK
jgi:hypothetical protein